MTRAETGNYYIFFGLMAEKTNLGVAVFVAGRFNKI